MTKDEIEHNAYLFFREKGLEYVDNIDELIEYCRDFAYPFISYFEEKIADLKENCDYVLEGKEIEYIEERNKLCADFENMKAGLESQIATLGKRCNQLLKDKGNLVEELQELKETLAQTIENDKVIYETLKLHDQEEIGMLNSKIAGLEQQIEKMKSIGRTAYIKGIRTMANALKDYDRTEGAWTDYFEHTVDKVLKKLLGEIKEK